MKVSLLYKIFGTGIVVVTLIVMILWKIEHSLLPHEDTAEQPPTYSGLTEVEFESGVPVQTLNEADQKRLHAYRGNLPQDATVEVPIDRAIDTYLNQQKGVEK